MSALVWFCAEAVVGESVVVIKKLLQLHVSCFIQLCISTCKYMWCSGKISQGLILWKFSQSNFEDTRDRTHYTLTIVLILFGPLENFSLWNSFYTCTIIYNVSIHVHITLR